MGWGESEITVVGDSKILTVSYGTFSCTLEGFDDPFSTMKAIAEYFRDLAAGDRFFGAEPPQPDADMLHKIAEQTIQSPVNAEVSDNSLILRQDHAAAAAPAAPAPAPVTAPIVSEVETPTFDDAAPVDATVQSAVTEPASFTDSDSIAAKLQRIRAVVSREAAEPVEDAVSYNEDEHADEFASDANTSSADAFDEEYEAEGPAAQADLSEAAEAEAPHADTSEVDAEEVEAVAEDAADQAVSEDTAEVVEDAAEVSEDAEISADAETEVEVEEAETAAVEDVAETASETEADAQTETEAEAVVDAEAVADAEAEDTASEDVIASDDTSGASAQSEDVNGSAQDDVQADADTAQDDATPVKQRRRIIVQKVSRAEVEAAHADAPSDMAQDTSDALDPEAEAALLRELADVEADMVATDDTIEASSDEDDGIDTAALAAALADSDAPQADAETADATPADVDEDKDAVANVLADAAAEEADENRASRIARRSALVEDEDAALDRLMDATSTRLSDDDEGAVRRASIAHLKAAVAATKADDSIAKAAADEEEKELDQYRSDLARVVRPGRPRTEGTSTSRPSPLVLVSEQRIDDPSVDDVAAAAVDVRPRRITSGNLALQEEMEEEAAETLYAAQDVEDFGAYATRYEALELPDLLEAAAAHFTYVEDTPSFTRPMLMRKISTITTAEAPSREAGLRSFGSLLREGKIVKGDDGKFVISGKSRFAPDAQEAGA